MAGHATAQSGEVPSFVRHAGGLSLREFFTAPVRSVGVGGRVAAALLTNDRIESWGPSAAFCDPWTTPTGAPIVEIAVGGRHVLARCADGSVIAQGDNLAGQCNVPPLPTGLSYVRVYAGNQTSFAIRSDGEAIRFGSPTPLPHPPGVGYAKIAHQDTNPLHVHTVAILADGSLQATGDNTYGQCNVPALPAGVVATAVACGFGSSLALLSDGSLRAWGDNSQGQCNIPALPAGVTYVKIAAGWATQFALRSDGTLAAWGSNQSGQLAVPSMPPGRAIVDIAASHHASIAAMVLSDGTVRAWGGGTWTKSPSLYVPRSSPGSPTSDATRIGNFGFVVQREDHTIDYVMEDVPGTPLPTPPVGTFYRQVVEGVGLRSDGEIVGVTNAPVNTPSNPFTVLAMGQTHAMVLRQDGTIAAWGANNHGQCNVPTSLARATAIACGGSHSLALRPDGHVEAWGADNFGQCRPPFALQPARAVMAGGRHTLVLHPSGIEAVGSNNYGQLNVPAPPTGTSYVSLAAGWNYSGAIRSDGQAVVWGGNDSAVRSVPSLPASTTYTALAIGEGHALGLRSDGQVLAWGGNYYGECNVPGLPNGTTYVEVAAGSRFSVARRSDGQVVAWGGLGSQYTAVPSLPPGATYVEITATQFTAIARRSDGALVVWGQPTGAQGIPTLPAGVTFTEVQAGLDHCAARLSNGTVVVWGTPSFGLLNVPPLPASTTYTQIWSGRDHVVAQRSDGAWVAWGDNTYGQCAQPPFSPVVKIAANYDTSYALCADGTLVQWPRTLYPPPPPPGERFVELDANWRHSNFGVVRASNGATLVSPHFQFGPWTGLSPAPGQGAVLRRARAFEANGFPSVLEVWGPPVEITPLGPGCAGSLPVTDIQEQNRPALGAPIHLRLDHLPMNVALVAIGFTKLPGIDLGFAGAPGCPLHVSLDVIGVAVGSQGEAVFDLVFPSAPPIGTALHVQALAFDAGVNALEAVTSNAITATLVGK